jgi:hypothetical protein
MTEQQIERRVELMMDELDEKFLKLNMRQGEYDQRCDAINKWADEQYRKIYPKW